MWLIPVISVLGMNVCKVACIFWVTFRSLICSTKAKWRHGLYIPVVTGSIGLFLQLVIMVKRSIHYSKVCIFWHKKARNKEAQSSPKPLYSQSFTLGIKICKCVNEDDTSNGLIGQTLIFCIWSRKSISAQSSSRNAELYQFKWVL